MEADAFSAVGALNRPSGMPPWLGSAITACGLTRKVRGLRRGPQVRDAAADLRANDQESLTSRGAAAARQTDLRLRSHLRHPSARKHLFPRMVCVPEARIGAESVRGRRQFAAKHGLQGQSTPAEAMLKQLPRVWATDCPIRFEVWFAFASVKDCLSSIVLLVENDSSSALLTGDARGDKTLKGLKAASLLGHGKAIHLGPLKGSPPQKRQEYSPDSFRQTTRRPLRDLRERDPRPPGIKTLDALVTSRNPDDNYTVHLEQHAICGRSTHGASSRPAGFRSHSARWREPSHRHHVGRTTTSSTRR